MLIDILKEYVQRVEDDFRSGQVSDTETCLRLSATFGEDLGGTMFNALYAARKHDNWPT